MMYDKMVVAESSLDGAETSYIIAGADGSLPPAPVPEGTSDMNAENLRSGWIRVYRSMLDHHLWNQHPPEYLKIWLYFLLKASRKARPWWDGHQEITIPVGAFVGSIATIAEKNRVSKKQAERAIAMFRECQMIVAKPGSSYTLYTIVNFDSYNSPSDETGKPRGSEGEASGTPRGSQGEAEGKRRGTNNRREEKRERKEGIFGGDSESETETRYLAFRDAYPIDRRKDTALARQYYVQATGGLEVKHGRLMAALKTYVSRTEARFVQSMERWLESPPWHLADQAPEGELRVVARDMDHWLQLKAEGKVSV